MEVAKITQIDQYLKECRELVYLTTMGGWIDDKTTQFTVLKEEGNSAQIQLKFEEILMSNSGCNAGRAECWGKADVTFDADGKLEKFTLVEE